MSEDEEGLRRFFKQFSFPGGIGSHCTPETPGSIHEGGELGYSVSHACGAAFDNPDLIVAVDGRRRRGRNRPAGDGLALNKFLNPIRDGAVLPILHLNGYKINNPTILARVTARGDGSILPRLRLDAVLRRGVRPARPCTRRWPRRWTSASRRSARSRKRPGRRASPVRPALADDHTAHPERMDQPGRGRRPQARRLLAAAPGADGGRHAELRSIWRCWRNGCAATSRRSYSTKRGACSRSCAHRARPGRGASGPTRTPTGA